MSSRKSPTRVSRSSKGGPRRPEGSAKSGSRSNTTKHVRDCVCGRGLACVGMTQAFRLLGDPRCYYVELPRFRKDPPAYKYTFRNNLRAAYLRHLHQLNPSSDFSGIKESPQRHYVALHHFHPEVVKAFYENPLTSGTAQKHKVPISITEHELKEMNLQVNQEDRILSVTGVPTGGYYFCPSYPQEKAHDDLKELIKIERASREAKAEAEKDKSTSPGVPAKIEVAVKTNDLQQQQQQYLGMSNYEGKQLQGPAEEPETHEEPMESEAKPQELSPEVEAAVESKNADTYKVEEKQQEHVDDFSALVSDTNDTEFNSLWAEDADQSPEVPIVEGSGVEAELAEQQENSDEMKDHTHAGDTEIDDPAASVTTIEPPESKLMSPLTSSASLPRGTDHPWSTPKYRRDLHQNERNNRIVTTPAEFIDPSIVTRQDYEETEVETAVGKSTITSPDDEEVNENEEEAELQLKPTTSTLDNSKSDAASAAQKSAASISAAALFAMKSTDDADGVKEDKLGGVKEFHTDNTSRAKLEALNDERNSPHLDNTGRINGAISENESFDQSANETGKPSRTIFLSHNFPGTDPTLRIQVHNDLIAWESKRRSEIARLLKTNGEKWAATKETLQEGLSELQQAERLVLGFGKAGTLFANALHAVYDDKLLDDSGKTVGNSFLQNRLHRKRSAQEYSIENVDSADAVGQSTLLISVLEAQKQVALSFEDCSKHIEDEISPELKELNAEIVSSSKKIEALGDSVLSEMKRSEIEVKGIWDVFDAMVTGDLMEYSVHGSLHGGSQHGGSMHSLGPGTGSLHGLISPRGDSEGPIVSSVNSPLVKSTFRQLGALDDGWIIEMHYRCSVAYQRAVFSIAENELEQLIEQTAILERQRFQRLHQVMLAFVPRQRRLFKSLPDHLREVLNNLVGLRIDEDSLQSLIDDSIRDRSHDHLKRGASHRSSIMNRSKVNKTRDPAESDIDAIEQVFGDPFRSSLVVLAKVVEMQQGGLRGMVNTVWKSALVVVTSEGKFHLFTLPADASGAIVSPPEAFRLLYPTMAFDSADSWRRRSRLVGNLSPVLTLELGQSSLMISKLQNRQVQVAEDTGNEVTGNRFVKAVKAAADKQRSKKCTLRLPSALEASEWLDLLERTKNVVAKKATIMRSV